MKKLTMVGVMLAMVALVAIAPVLAQDDSGDPKTPGGGAPGKGPDIASEKASPQEALPKEAPPQEAFMEKGPPQEAPPQESPPPREDPIQEAPPKEAPPQEALPQEVPRQEEFLPKETPLEVGDQKADVSGGAKQYRDDQEAKVSGLGKDEGRKANDDGDAKQAVKDRNDRNDRNDQKADDDNDSKAGDQNGDGVEQKIGQEADSGDVDQSVNVINTGDYANQCVAVLQAANSGNLQNGQGVAQYDSETDDIGAGGSKITVTPQLVQDCRQVILQIVEARETRQPRETRGARDNLLQVGRGIAGSGERITAAQLGVGQPAVGLLRAGGGQPKASAATSGRAASATSGSLPRTGGFSGGDAAILGLGAGALITTGGLLIRRTSR